MISIEQLKFAQKYPFTEIARIVLKNKKFSFEDVSEHIFKRAALMISKAAKNELYLQERISESTEILENEIIAFPVAKVLIALMNNVSLKKKFSLMFAETTFKYLELEQDRTQTMLGLAKELSVEFELTSNEDFFVKIPLTNYLKIRFKEPYMKLVNQNISNGKIFLRGNEFARFLSELVFDKIYYSFPEKNELQLPKEFQSVANQLAEQLKSKERKEFDEILKTKVNPSAFPPCMNKIYQDLLEGKNVQHMARFVFATFAVSIGMPTEAIIQLYSKTPNFNEKLTRYHVENIAGKKGLKKRYSAPSRDKIVSYSLCPNPKICENYKHPVLYYKKQLRKVKSD